jgi:hypothetical protein
MRLIAAIGMIAIAALATGGLASLTARPAPRDAERVRPPKAQAAPRIASPIDATAMLEAQVEDAERELQKARAAIRAARLLGQVDGQLLDEFERRLERAAKQSASTPAPALPVERSHEPIFAPQPRSL